METLTKNHPTVAEIAAGSLAAVKVFERLGIDYCCGGKRPLADVCREKGYEPAQVEAQLDAAINAPAETARDWNTAPFAELIGHIVSRHHEYLKRELGPLEARVQKVYDVYNQRYGPTLQGLPEVVAGLSSELLMHLQKEERILFPAILGQGMHACGVAGPISVMEAEHESAGDALARIREITENYTIPEYACVTYRSMIAGLRELEEDLHMHIHLENNILFPRALAKC